VDSTRWSLDITVAEGRHEAFLLVADRADGRRRRVTYGPFYSEALRRTRHSAWIYPALPFTAAYDLITTPPLLALAIPYAAVGD
jgi:hypothetical protein